MNWYRSKDSFVEVYNTGKKMTSRGVQNVELSCTAKMLLTSRVIRVMKRVAGSMRVVVSAKKLFASQ
jgi:hypothetical protein